MNDNSSTHDFLAKIILVGDSGVGKTNLLTKYCDDQFQDSYVATIGVDFKLKMVRVEKTMIKLQIWDTAGQERFRNITQTYFKGAAGIILAYEITKRQTFQNISTWIKQIQASSDEDTVKILVGTKIDLQSEREVETREGKEMALRNNMLFEEVSARSGINVEQAFMRMAREIQEKKYTNRWEVSNSLGLLLKTRSGIQKKKNCLC